MTKITIEVPDKITLHSNHAKGHDIVLTPATMTPETVAAIFLQGTVIYPQRRPSSWPFDMDGKTKVYKLTQAEKIASFDKMVKELNDNTYSFGTGGGGGRLDPVDVEYRAVLDSLLKTLGQTSKERAATMAAFDRDNVIAVAAGLMVKAGKAKDVNAAVKTLTTKIAAKVKTRLSDMDDLLA